MGVYFLTHTEYSDENALGDKATNVDIFVVKQIPTKSHYKPTVVKSKEEELDKWEEYEAFKEVEDGNDKFTGPGKVTGTDGNKICIIQMGYDRTVPNNLVIPFEQETFEVTDYSKQEEEPNTVVEVETQESVTGTNSSNPETTNGYFNMKTRPKRNDTVTFKIGDTSITGRVSKVGKKTGHDKHCCWIKHKKEVNGVMKEVKTDFDFVNDVDSC